MKRNKILAFCLSLLIMGGMSASCNATSVMNLGSTIAYADENTEATPMSPNDIFDTQSFTTNGLNTMSKYIALGDKIFYTNGRYTGGSAYTCNLSTYQLEGTEFNRKLYSTYATTFDSLGEVTVDNLKITGGVMKKNWEQVSTYMYYKSRNKTFSGALGSAKYVGITSSARADSNGDIWAIAKGSLYQCTTSSGTVKASIGSESTLLKEIDTKDGEICLVADSTVYKLNADNTVAWKTAKKGSGDIVYSVIDDGYYNVYSQSGSTLYKSSYSLTDGTSEVLSISLSSYGTTAKFANLIGSENYDDKQYDGFMVFVNGTSPTQSTILKLDKELNIVSANSISGIEIGAVTYNGKGCVGTVSSATPELASGVVFLNLDLDNSKYDPVFSKYNTTFKYNSSLGVETSTNVQIPYKSIIQEYAPSVSNDSFNYRVFDYWIDKDGNKITEDIRRDTQECTITAVYKESENSFWLNENRYGIISTTAKTVAFLGSKNENVTVPKTINYEGEEYSVILKKNCAMREGNIKNITVDGSSLLDTSTFANSKLESIKIIGNATIPDDCFKDSTELKYIDCPGVVEFKASSISGCESLEAIKGSQSDVGKNEVLENKVYLYNSDGTKVLGNYWVKSGTNFTSYANMVGKNWTKISGSMLLNIISDSEYQCSIEVNETEKLTSPVLTISKSNANNRDKGVTVEVN